MKGTTCFEERLHDLVEFTAQELGIVSGPLPFSTVMAYRHRWLRHRHDKAGFVREVQIVFGAGPAIIKACLEGER
jgi:hypothetical protein